VRLLAVILLISLASCRTSRQPVIYVPVPSERYYEEKRQRNTIWFVTWYAITLTAVGFLLSGKK
jgi:hypothetical protein